MYYHRNLTRLDLNRKNLHYKTLLRPSDWAFRSFWGSPSIILIMELWSLILVLWQNSGHTWAKGYFKVDGLRKKLSDEIVCFSLMNKQCYLLSVFSVLTLWNTQGIKEVKLMCDSRSQVVRSGVHRASSSDAQGPGFDPRPLCFKKYLFFTPKP